MTHRINTNTPVTVTVDPSVKIFEIALWVLFILPGLIFMFCKLSAENYFHALEQKIYQYDAQVQNYLEQRVVVLKNCAKLVGRAVELDRDVYERIAQYRSGNVLTGEGMTQLNSDLNALSHSIQATVENYPALGAHEEIREAMRQNQQLQREISSARDLLNGAIYTWNRDIFKWLTYRVVAAEQGYATKPFFETECTEPEDTFF